MKILFATAATIALSTSIVYAQTRSATITRVEPNYQTVFQNVPRTQCQDVEVPVYGTAQGGGNAGEGALLGMIIGGVLGDAISGGKGDATAGGAIIGGIIGADRAQNGTRQVVTGYRTERQCSEVMVREQQREIRNYTITYEWNGVQAQSFTYNRYSVGDRIPVTVSIVAQ
jgi:uncharacterized protein YcfJ